jgi:hypothetical protein
MKGINSGCACLLLSPAATLPRFVTGRGENENEGNKQRLRLPSLFTGGPHSPASLSAGAMAKMSQIITPFRAPRARHLKVRECQCSPFFPIE